MTPNLNSFNKVSMAAANVEPKQKEYSTLFLIITRNLTWKERHLRIYFETLMTQL